MSNSILVLVLIQGDIVARANMSLYYVNYLADKVFYNEVLDGHCISWKDFKNFVDTAYYEGNSNEPV